jgi:hypothetical protein
MNLRRLQRASDRVVRLPAELVFGNLHVCNPEEYASRCTDAASPASRVNPAANSRESGARGVRLGARLSKRT